MTNTQELDLAEERKVFVIEEYLIKNIRDALAEQSKELLAEFDKTLSKNKGIWNITQDSLGCVATDGYNLIQHREVVLAVEQTVGNLNIPHDSTIRVDGHRIFYDINFKHEKLKVLGEEFTCGFRLINSYDKTTGLLILPRLERLVCLNGMVIKKLVPGYCIRHNQKIAENFQAIIEKALKQMINSDKKLQQMVEVCIGDSVEWQIVDTIMSNLIGRKNHIEGIMSKLEHTDRVTRWELYNAITNYATHGEQLKPNVENWLQNKAQRLLDRPLVMYSRKMEVEA
jgi:hypothetical protein